MDLVNAVLGRPVAFSMKDVFCCDGMLNMTFLALNLSHFINGVAKKHSEISQHMFARYVIDSITNGVHAATWTSTPFQRLFDANITGWRKDNFSLRSSLGIPRAEIWQAHEEAKGALVQHVNSLENAAFAPDVLTIGFARRAASYKRADLFFHDLDRLRRIAQMGKVQVVYAGKAHPADQSGKEIIRRIFEFKAALKNEIPIVYLENYDIALGKLVTSGVDLWLNTPEPPLEASGTSGMKAALNGVPSFSVLDGWWIEGCIEGVTGWGIGPNGRRLAAPDRSGDAASLYDKLEKTIIPLFYDERDRWIEVMRHAIALNGSFFNTQRMLQQYVVSAYFL
jgi:starch phosphorylase